MCDQEANIHIDSFLRKVLYTSMKKIWKVKQIRFLYLNPVGPIKKRGRVRTYIKIIETYLKLDHTRAVFKVFR